MSLFLPDCHGGVRQVVQHPGTAEHLTGRQPVRMGIIMQPLTLRIPSFSNLRRGALHWSFHRSGIQYQGGFRASSLKSAHYSRLNHQGN